MSTDFYTSMIMPHAGIIIKICRAYTNSQEDFEDYYQEVCLQIWRSRDQFEKRSQWSTWIYRLSLNVCMTLLKKSKRDRNRFASDYHSGEHTDVHSDFENKSLNLLYDGIRQLTEVDRAVILLYLENKPYEEIATIMGTNANNIGVRINRIKNRLKRILNGKIN